VLLGICLKSLSPNITPPRNHGLTPHNWCLIFGGVGLYLQISSLVPSNKKSRDAARARVQSALNEEHHMQHPPELGGSNSPGLLQKTTWIYDWYMLESSFTSMGWIFSPSWSLHFVDYIKLNPRSFEPSSPTHFHLLNHIAMNDIHSVQCKSPPCLGNIQVDDISEHLFWQSNAYIW